MAITGYPPPPTSVPNRNDAQARRWGPGWPNCQTDKLTTVQLSNGVRITVRREVADLIRDLLDYVLIRGYIIRPKVTGGFNCRAIVGSDPPVASNHSWGLAVDVNWDVNALGDDEPGEVDIPKWMVSLMWAHGWYWGGWYGREDAMHFEYVHRPSDVAAHAASAKANLDEIKEADMTPEQDSKLNEVWLAVTRGERPGPNQTSGGGVPIPWLSRQFWEIDTAAAALASATARIEAKMAELANQDDEESPAGGLTAAQIGDVVQAEIVEAFGRVATPDSGTQ